MADKKQTGITPGGVVQGIADLLNGVKNFLGEGFFSTPEGADVKKHKRKLKVQVTPPVYRNTTTPVAVFDQNGNPMVAVATDTLQIGEGINIEALSTYNTWPPNEGAPLPEGEGDEPPILEGEFEEDE